MARRTAKVKGLLLNQSLIAGLGNIYADEALFHAGIHPQREGRSLTEKELEELHRAIVTVIEEGITHRGTTIRNYVDGSGKSGGYQERLQVYGKEGDPCPRCKTTLQREGRRPKLLSLSQLPAIAKVRSKRLWGMLRC